MGCTTFIIALFYRNVQRNCMCVLGLAYKMCYWNRNLNRCFGGTWPAGIVKSKSAVVDYLNISLEALARSRLSRLECRSCERELSRQECVGPCSIRSPGRDVECASATCQNPRSSAGRTSRYLMCMHKDICAHSREM